MRLSTPNTPERTEAYDRTSVSVLGELGDGIARLAVINEDLRVRADTGEMVSGWRIADILHEFRVRFYCLFKWVRSTSINT